MANAGAGSERTDPAYLGLEIGELAAWITMTYGADRPERQWRKRFMTPPTPDEFFQHVAEGACIARGGAGIAGVGVATWAHVNSADGSVQASAISPDWESVALATRLSDLLHAPVRLRSAVDAAALAETRLGVGKGADPVVYVHLGREVLSALVYHCAPLIGAHGRAGQIGHWRIAEDGPRCACGAVGHLNPLCSSQGFVRQAIGLAALDESVLAAMTEATGGRVEAITAQRVVALASAGVTPLRDLTRRSAEALGIALARLALVVDPEVIVLDGPLGVAGSPFIEWTGERMTEELRAVSGGEQAPRLASARLAPLSALTGAWLLGKDAADK